MTPHQRRGEKWNQSLRPRPAIQVSLQSVLFYTIPDLIWLSLPYFSSGNRRSSFSYFTGLSTIEICWLLPLQKKNKTFHALLFPFLLFSSYDIIKKSSQPKRETTCDKKKKLLQLFQQFQDLHFGINLNQHAPQIYFCPVGWGCRIHWLHLFRGVRPPPPNECPGYDTKQSDREVPAVLELWGMRSTPSLPLLPGPLWPGVVAPDRALSMD